GAVSVTSGLNVTLLDSNDIVLGAMTVSGNLDVTAGGNVTQTGALSVTGTSSFTVTAATSDILLHTQANNFTGAVTVSGSGGGSVRDLGLRNTNAGATLPALPVGMRNLTLIFNNAALTLPAVTLSGNLSATAGGALTVAGKLTVAGTVQLTATGAININ